MLSRFKWVRDPANPVLPPDPDSRYDCSQCMNPFALRIDDEYRLYYAGGDAIRLARQGSGRRWPTRDARNTQFVLQHNYG